MDIVIVCAGGRADCPSKCCVFVAEETVFTIYTEPDDFNAVAEALGKKYTFVSAQIEQVPNEYKKLDNEDDIKMMEKLIDAFEDDDVQNVWHNWEQD